MIRSVGTAGELLIRMHLAKPRARMRARPWLGLGGGSYGEAESLADGDPLSLISDPLGDEFLQFEKQFLYLTFFLKLP